MEKVRAQYGSDFVSLCTEEFLAIQPDDVDLDRLRAKIEEVRELNMCSLLLEMKFAKNILAFQDFLCNAKKFVNFQELESLRADLLSEELRLGDLLKDYDKRTASDAAREKAYKKHKIDPKSKAIKSVYACWLDWQNSPGDYKRKADFARAMLDKHDVLENVKYIQTLCTLWEKGGRPKEY